MQSDFTVIFHFGRLERDILSMKTILLKIPHDSTSFSLPHGLVMMRVNDGEI